MSNSNPIFSIGSKDNAVYFDLRKIVCLGYRHGTLRVYFESEKANFVSDNFKEEDFLLLLKAWTEISSKSMQTIGN